MQITPDRAFFDKRRRVKNETELAGIRKAQRGTEAAMDAARDLFRRARAVQRSADGRRRDADLRARQGADHGRLQRARPRHRRDDRRPRPADRARPRLRLRPDRGRRADRARPLPARSRIRLLRRHDPHVLHRRAAREARRVPPARQGGARPVARGRQGGSCRKRGLRARVRRLPRGRLPDAALEAGGRGARPRLLPRARPRRRARGPRAAVALARPQARSRPAT